MNGLECATQAESQLLFAALLMMYPKVVGRGISIQGIKQRGKTHSSGVVYLAIDMTYAIIRFIRENHSQANFRG
tara:strand:+ start:768 stop:989 length:222 start_codon:yes stop_codon:yes gene_type:complete